MSWLFSQALGEEFSAVTCSDGEPFAQLNVMPTPHKFWRNDRTMEPSDLSRFGLTLQLLTESRGEELLTLYLAGFRARTSVSRGKGRESPERVAVCGRTWHELSEKYDLDSCSWKIHHSLFPVELDWSSVTLPRWGMTVSGQLYQHQISERPISATGSGLWATPTTMDKLPPKSEAALHREATVARPGRSKPANLRDQVSNMQNWPTPCATDYKGAGKNGELRDRLDYAVERGATKSKDYSLEVILEDGGQLNPTWVEWLMGWPLGWTDLKPLEMDKFHVWQQQHSKYFQDIGEAAA